MPYHLEKGPLFANIEALYNEPARLAVFLHRLWQGQPLGGLGLLAGRTFDGPDPNAPNARGPDRLNSMAVAWFGEDAQGNQPDFGEVKDGRRTFTTGYWAHYYGQVRSIVTETLTRAAELALGVERPDPVVSPAEMKRPEPWRVEFFWKCGQPRFEGWVTWRDHQEGGDGQVTVIFATPATPDQVLRRPAEQAEQVRKNRVEKWQGMWVCSHADHRQHVMITCLPTRLGDWIVPFDAVMFTEGVGEVGTWAPRFGSGGTPDAPKQFVPPA